ncbi:hypothetical protein ACFFHM_01925 [Halalkalibacter kiskunsagensis]|uniref:Uncharacterized protein n=1 Tax=Halalkalibacter kiskunsagensis TaxID=1548599 RepID=A0ABV6K8C9_9BACI
MRDDQNQQPDFFTELMFGKRPSQPEQPEISADQSEPNQEMTEEQNQNEPLSNQQSNPQTDQLANIMALVQSLSPYLVKLAPLASKVTDYFTQENKEENSKKKNADD